MFIVERDRGKETLKEDWFPYDADKVESSLLKDFASGFRNPRIKLELIDWERAGLRIGICVADAGNFRCERGYHNKNPYRSREIATKDYEVLRKSLEAGKYKLNMERRRVELVLNE